MAADLSAATADAAAAAAAGSTRSMHRNNRWRRGISAAAACSRSKVVHIWQRCATEPTESVSRSSQFTAVVSASGIVSYTVISAVTSPSVTHFVQSASAAENRLKLKCCCCSG